MKKVGNVSKARADDDEGPSSSAESLMRFPRDIRLRDHGFRIVSRPPGGSAVWSRDGKEYLEAVAVKVCDREDKEGGRCDGR